MKNNPVILQYESILLHSLSKEELVTLMSETSWINKNSKLKNNPVILKYEAIFLDSISKGKLWHLLQVKWTKIENWKIVLSSLKKESCHLMKQVHPSRFYKNTLMTDVSHKHLYCTYLFLAVKNMYLVLPASPLIVEVV